MFPAKPTATKSAAPTLFQTACIDLPGESVECWRSIPHIKVVLRKHRDLIFNIKLFKGMTYTLHADQGDFYDAVGKKLVQQGGRVTFHDGEQAHLWVSREFSGSIILSSKGKVLGRYTPNKIDFTTFYELPTSKPAPLIIVLNNEKPVHPAITAGMAASAGRPQQVPDEMMHIIEVKPDSPHTPEAVAKFFKGGGEETAIDPNGQLTRNWLWGTIAGFGAYYSDNKHWIKELWKQKFRLQKVVHPHAGTKYYIIFKGNQKLREYFTGTRYGINNAKVLAITSGVGSAAGMRHGAWDAAKGTFKKAGLFAVFFTIALDTAEWVGDYEQIDPKTGKRKKDFFDLAFKIGVDLTKAGISAVIGAVAVGALVFLGVITGGAAIVIGALVVSVIVGLALDWLDKKTGATDKLNKSMREGGAYLEKKLPADYNGFGETLQQAMSFGGMGA